MSYERDRFQFTNVILDRAEKLKLEDHLSWEQVAKRLGCTSNSLQVTISKRRNGKLQGKVDATIHRKKILEARARDRPIDIARDLGVSSQAVCDAFKNLGLDGEVRAEMRRGEWDEVSE